MDPHANRASGMVSASTVISTMSPPTTPPFQTRHFNSGHSRVVLNLTEVVASANARRVPAQYQSEFLIWGALSLMRNGSFPIWVSLSPMRNSQFLISNELPRMRNSLFLIRVCLPLIRNTQFLIRSRLSPMRNRLFLNRVCLSLMGKR